MQRLRPRNSIVKVGNYINGSIRFAENEIRVQDPSSGQVVATCARGTETDVQGAVSSGFDAFKQGKWSRMHSSDRFAVLMAIARRLETNLDEFAYWESLQTGRPIREMQVQLKRLPEWIEYFASLARTAQGSVPQFKGDMLNVVHRVPLGVVGQITPWNHPLLIAIKKLAPALAAGNSVVVKPSELAPVNVVRFGEMCLPEGVLNVVTGYGKEVGHALVSDTRIAMLDITGGTETGKLVASQAGRNLIGCIAELGGKSPVVVFPDALDEGVDGAMFAAFIASGQTCVMGSRVLVHESVYDQFIAKMALKTCALKIGDPQDVETQIGPVITRESLERIHAHVKNAVKEGARLVCGGMPLEAPGNYYLPTILGDVIPSMSIFKQEVFGPVVAVTKFSTTEQALEMANDSEFGLGASIWTRDIKTAHCMANQIDVGIVWINGHHHNDPASPWGGFKNSGMGRENGMEAFNAYTQPKSVIINYGASSNWFGDSRARYG